MPQVNSQDSSKSWIGCCLFHCFLTTTRFCQPITLIQVSKSLNRTVIYFWKSSLLCFLPLLGPSLAVYFQSCPVFLPSYLLPFTINFSPHTVLWDLAAETTFDFSVSFLLLTFVKHCYVNSGWDSPIDVFFEFSFSASYC